MSSHPYSDLPIILITGIGRSGTTVVTKSIQQHPEVYSNGVESNAISDFMSAALKNCTLESRKRQLVVTQETYEKEVQDFLLRIRFPVDQSPAKTPKALSTFTAMTSDVAEFANSVFGKVVWVCIIRNGIEVVSSRMAHRNFGKQSFRENCLTWNRAGDMFGWANTHENAVVLRHEELHQPVLADQKLARLFGKAGIENNPKCLDYFSRVKRNSTSVEKESEKVQQDLTLRHERWKFWTDEERETFKEVCGSQMELMGYPIPF